MLRGVKVIVIMRQRCNVNQTFNMNPVEFDKRPKRRNASDYTDVRGTDLILHKLTLKPGGNIAHCILRTTFGHRAVIANLGDARNIVGKILFTFMYQPVLDCAVHHQIRVAPYR